MTFQDARERVAKGAAHLDQVTPGWASRIDTGNLHLGSCFRCVIGQLLGSYYYFGHLGLNGPTSRTMGFNIDRDDNSDTVAEFQMLQDAWIEAICDRLLPTSDEGTPADAVATPVAQVR